MEAMDGEVRVREERVVVVESGELKMDLSLIGDLRVLMGFGGVGDDDKIVTAIFGSLSLSFNHTFFREEIDQLGLWGGL